MIRKLIYLSYVPYKYDLEKFADVGSLEKDHTDPSIFTVLTAKSKTSGAAIADFLVLGSRWDVATNTLRIPVSIEFFAPT